MNAGVKIMKMITPFTVPRNILITAERQMPSDDASISDGGRDGRYGGVYRGILQDSIRDVVGYDSVVIFVRKGLGKMEIIKPVIDAVVDIQKKGNRDWSLVPISHGWEDGFRNSENYPQKKNRYFAGKTETMARSLCELAGEDLEKGKLTITDFYPRTRTNRLCPGKSFATNEDLLVFVDVEKSPSFPAEKRHRVNLQMKRNMIFVRVSKDLSRSEWKMGVKEVKFV